jgi:eukaryotic translation initiation factor 2-alpha kinase 4
VSICLFLIYGTCSIDSRSFSVYPRTRSARRDQPAFRIKSILKGTEYDGK